MSKELIYRDDARKAVLCEVPGAVYCIDSVRAVDAIERVYITPILSNKPVSVLLTMQCNRCGAYMLQQDFFCPHCGATVRDTE